VTHVGSTLASKGRKIATEATSARRLGTSTVNVCGALGAVVWLLLHDIAKQAAVTTTVRSRDKKLSAMSPPQFPSVGQRADPRIRFSCVDLRRCSDRTPAALLLCLPDG